MSQVDMTKSRGQDVVRILMVEDDAELASQLKEELLALYEEGGGEIRVEIESTFTSAMNRVESSTFDLLILDLRLDENRQDDGGAKILERVQELSFVPVIFHTAHPEHVRPYESPVVRVVVKGGRTVDSKRLPEVVEDVLRERLPQMKRALRQHVDGVLRDYMWQMVATGRSAELIKTPALLVHVLARQIVHSLDAAMLPKLFLAMNVDEKVAEGKIHPVQMYIYPPPYNRVRGAGDIMYLDSDKYGELSGYWMVLSARCDLVDHGSQRRRVDYVVMAKVCPIKEHPRANETKTEKQREFSRDAKGVIEKRDQYFVLPKLSDVLPYSYVDFGIVCSFSFELICTSNVVTTLDDPFAAEMLLKHQRFFGRFGTSDLDQDILRKFLDDGEPS